MAWEQNKDDELWGNNSEDPNRFLTQQAEANPYAGMANNYGGGSDYNSSKTQPYSDADVPAQTPPRASSTPYLGSEGGFDPRDNVTGNYDSRASVAYNRDATARGTRGDSASVAGSGSTKRLEGLPKVGIPQQGDYKTQEEYEKAYYGYYDKSDPRAKGGSSSTDKGANIVSPANSGGGGNYQPQRSSGGGYQPQTQYREQAQQRLQAPAGWNEREYLMANRDVAEAIAKGTMQDGYNHYMNHGKSEGRSLAPAAQRPQADPMAQSRADAQAQVARMQADARAQQQTQQQTQQRNDAQRQMMGAKVVGTGAGGEQIVRFTEGVPRGYTPDFAELSKQTGLGAASLMRAYRDQGGDFGGQSLGAGSGSGSGSAVGSGSVSPRGNSIIDAQGFNEAAYLSQNKDVADAVARGDYKSGYDHWATRGRNEVRAGGRELNEFEKANPWAIGMPVPDGGWKPQAAQQNLVAPAAQPTTPQGAPTTATQPPVSGAGADKYLAPEQRAGGTVAPGSAGAMPQPYTPPVATDNTGVNNTGGAGSWEYDPLRGEWVNGTTGETRPWGFDPNEKPVNGNAPAVATDGASGWQSSGINPFTGKPYTQEELDAIQNMDERGAGRMADEGMGRYYS